MDSYWFFPANSSELEYSELEYWTFSPINLVGGCKFSASTVAGWCCTCQSRFTLEIMDQSLNWNLEPKCNFPLLLLLKTLAGAPSEFLIDGLENFLKEGNCLNLTQKISSLRTNITSQLNCPKIDGFENLFLKVDGFGRTHPEGAPVTNFVIDYVYEGVVCNKIIALSPQVLRIFLPEDKANGIRIILYCRTWC